MLEKLLSCYENKYTIYLKLVNGRQIIAKVIELKKEADVKVTLKILYELDQNLVSLNTEFEILLDFIETASPLL